MDQEISSRVGLVVWLYTTKYVNKLKRYGLVHYVSKNMNYAIIYVDREEKEVIKNTIAKQHFVRKVEDSYQCELPKTFDGILDEVVALSKKVKDDSLMNGISN
ncbi:MAG: YlbG family protein [Alkalibacterium sp.]|uniref:YlbG family protein n=1 Tax=Alkalibacterium sp. TaxID=1872447 RepID=UPI003970882D